MDLKQKAKWHLEINNGLVPILELPTGEIIIESYVIQMWAHEMGKDEGLQLLSKDPLTAARQRIIIESLYPKLPPYIATFYYWRGNTDVDEKINEYRDKALPALDGFVKNNLKGDFFGGDKPDIVDCFCFPVLERNCFFEGTDMGDIVDYLKLKENLPNLNEYVKRMRNFELFKTLVPTQESFTKMFADLKQKPKQARTIFEVRYLD